MAVGVGLYHGADRSRREAEARSCTKRLLLSRKRGCAPGENGVNYPWHRPRLSKNGRAVMEAWVTIRSASTAASSASQRAEAMPHTVHTVNAGDYTAEQLDAWADGAPDLEECFC